MSRKLLVLLLAFAMLLTFTPTAVFADTVTEENTDPVIESVENEVTPEVIQESDEVLNDIAGNIEEGYTGWDDSHTHYYEDGVLVKDGLHWVYDEEAGDDDLYYFDENSGELRTGFIDVEVEYEDPEGGTYTETNTYYGDPAKGGAMATGWKWINDAWYYFCTGEEDNPFFGYAVMYYDGLFPINTKTFYFDENGRMFTGWIEEYNEYTDEETGEVYNWTSTYYANASGEIQYEWQYIGGYWYYFEPRDENGWGGELHMNGSEIINGKPYYLSPDDGKMGSDGWIKETQTYDYDDGSTETYTYWFYANKDGVLKTGWQSIGGVWYYFEPDENYVTGYMYTGLRVINGKSYFFNSSGAMKAGGWVMDSGSWKDENGEVHTWTDWYYADSSGALAEGWKYIGGKWYYFEKTDQYGPGGYMYKDDVYKIDGKLYAFKKDGSLSSGGWIMYDWSEYYTDGKKHIAWVYADSNGIAKTDWQSIGGVWYYFNEWGVMQTGWQSLGGTWYYFNSSGIMQTGWQSIGGVWYYFNSSGAMKTGWQFINKTWYYFNSSGAMLTGWQKIDNVDYYFKSSGAMAANEWVNGYWWLSSDGAWTYKYQGSWKKSGTRWWFGDTSGWYAKNSTVTIDGKKYTFDSAGWLV